MVVGGLEGKSQNRQRQDGIFRVPEGTVSSDLTVSGHRRRPLVTDPKSVCTTLQKAKLKMSELGIRKVLLIEKMPLRI